MRELDSLVNLLRGGKATLAVLTAIKFTNILLFQQIYVNVVGTDVDKNCLE
jgi:hypothetical protein